MINEIFNENCLDTMARMNDNFIDLTVTSPPYDDLRDYNGYSYEFEKIAKELYRVTKKGGVVVWVVADATVKGSETGTSFRQALYFKECGFNLHDTMIYVKNNPMPYKHNRYLPSFEYMFVFSKGKPKTFNPFLVDTVNPNGKLTTTQREKDNTKRKGNGYGNRRNAKRYKFNVWNYNVGKNQSTKDNFAFEHPAIFPEKLANDHIISWSNEGDIIYDCFTGSGTTLKEASILNRNYIGSELSESYFAIAKKRVGEKRKEKENKTPTLFSEPN